MRSSAGESPFAVFSLLHAVPLLALDYKWVHAFPEKNVGGYPQWTGISSRGRSETPGLIS